MTVVPYLMIQPLADARRLDLKASAGARRRNVRPIELCTVEALARPQRLARLRHAVAR